jgi:capsular exopolysaccharide synthesis family protein
MSRIFDALQGTRSEASELLPGLMETGLEEQAPAGRTITPLEPDADQEAVPAPAGSPSVARRLAIAIPASAPLLPFQNPRTLAAEQYRIARTKIVHHPRKPRVIVVSSPSPADGKSVTAINLAGALALKGEANVLLIDADFRRPMVHDLLNVPKMPGLSEVISGECSFDEAVVQTEQYPNLSILANGEPKVNPSELLESTRWRALRDLVRSRYEYVIMDSPPVAAVADFDLLQMAADGIILVVRPEHTKRASCLKVLDTASKEKLLGVVLNGVESWFLGKHDSYYQYGYGSGGDRKK